MLIRGTFVIATKADWYKSGLTQFTTDSLITVYLLHMQKTAFAGN